MPDGRRSARRAGVPGTAQLQGAGPAADHVLFVQSAVSRVPKFGHMVPRGPHGPLCEPPGQSLPPRWLYPWKAGGLLQQRKHQAQTPALPFRIKTGTCLHAGKCLLATCTGSAAGRDGRRGLPALPVTPDRPQAMAPVLGSFTWSVILSLCAAYPHTGILSPLHPPRAPCPSAPGSLQPHPPPRGAPLTPNLDTPWPCCCPSTQAIDPQTLPQARSR